MDDRFHQMNQQPEPARSDDVPRQIPRVTRQHRRLLPCARCRPCANCRECGKSPQREYRRLSIPINARRACEGTVVGALRWRVRLRFGANKSCRPASALSHMRFPTRPDCRGEFSISPQRCGGVEVMPPVGVIRAGTEAVGGSGSRVSSRCGGRTGGRSGVTASLADDVRSGLDRRAGRGPRRGLGAVGS